jgi:glycosyltransferase involved in cell wall biosynthesis
MAAHHLAHPAAGDAAEALELTERAPADAPVLILSPWPSLFSMGGGGTPIGADLVNALLEGGYRVDFVGPSNREWNWMPEHDGLRVHRYRDPSSPIGGYLGNWITWLLRNLRLTVKALGVAKGHGRPQVVYAFSSLAIPAGVCCGRLLRRPTIGALFGTFLHPYLGRRIELLRRFDEVLAFKARVDRLVILNDGTRGDDVARRLGVPESRVRFWMHGLDLDACSAAMKADARSELGLPDGPLVVSASRLVGWKHVDRILRAVPGVLEARPDTVFALSGDGPDRATLEELARELSVGHAVRFLGALDRDVNLRLIASADVFCALYDYSCVGVALLEALGCGVAAVVADTGATRDFLEDGTNGFVVAPDDTDATAAAIVRLLIDGELRDRLGRTARLRAEERFLRPDERAALELETIAELGGADRPAG